MVRPRSCWVIYYFDTPTLERKHQLFGHVTCNIIIWASNLANDKLRVDNKHTYDHLVDASTKTIKYVNGPHGGWMGPQNITLNTFQKSWGFSPTFNWWWSNNQFALRTSSTREFLELKNLLVFQWMTIWILDNSSPYYWSRMAQPVMPNNKIIWFIKLLVHYCIDLDCTNTYIVQIWR